MSNLLLSFEENTNGSRTAPADGSGVTAWLTTAVIQNPQDGYYPTVGSPAASGTTSGGACTLSGLSGSDAYWVCIVDAGTQSHWFKVGVGSAGSGTTYPFTYVPSPVAETSITEITSSTLSVSNPTGPVVDIEYSPPGPTAVPAIKGVLTGSISGPLSDTLFGSSPSLAFEYHFVFSASSEIFTEPLDGGIYLVTARVTFRGFTAATGSVEVDVVTGASGKFGAELSYGATPEDGLTVVISEPLAWTKGDSLYLQVSASDSGVYVDGATFYTPSVVTITQLAAEI